MGDLSSEHFMFNDPQSACRTCLGLGTYRQVHPTLLVPDRKRSIKGGAFVKEAFKYNVETWDGKLMYSLSQHFGFSLDMPYEELSPETIKLLLYGTEGRKFTLLLPPGAKTRCANTWAGRSASRGYITRIERHYRRYRQKQEAHSHMEDYLEKVTVERPAPTAAARASGRSGCWWRSAARTSTTSAAPTSASSAVPGTGPAHRPQRGGRAGAKGDRRARWNLLLGIGLDYLSFNRRSGTLSGGESQRIRLSTQIGSGLMGMLYVLDEPSIGLHPKDNVKMIATLESLRDIGNTVIVVEHDEDTIRAADHIVEMGPGPGVHGGTVVVQGTIERLTGVQGLAHRAISFGQAVHRIA